MVIASRGIFLPFFSSHKPARVTSFSQQLHFLIQNQTTSYHTPLSFIMMTSPAVKGIAASKYAFAEKYAHTLPPQLNSPKAAARAAAAAAPPKTAPEEDIETIDFDMNSGDVKPTHEELVEPDDETSHIVKLSQADPNSPLHSATDFENLGLTKELLMGIHHMKFSKPSKIQEKSLPLLFREPVQNLIAQSQSGTGKTAAFVLAILRGLDFSVQQPQALCIAPTRELACQIMAVVRKMGRFTQVTTSFGIRELNSTQREALQGQVVIGTPGTILRTLKTRLLNASHIRTLVVDEADEMLGSQGMAVQVSRIKGILPRDCHYVLFSATFPENVLEFSEKFAPDANQIRLQHRELTVDAIRQYWILCANEGDKVRRLAQLYGMMTIGQIIVFCRTRNGANIVADKMINDGHAVTVLHAGYNVGERDCTIDDFRHGKSKVLICTNVLSRGIDIPQVNVVVNFDLPLDRDFRPDPETYLHRIGRTGRFGRTGISISLIHDEQSKDELRAMQEYFGREIVQLPEDIYQLSTILEKLKA